MGGAPAAHRNTAKGRSQARENAECGNTIENTTGNGKGGELMEITEVPTVALVDELKRREGVETHIADPYADLEVKVNGPATVLVVTD